MLDQNKTHKLCIVSVMFFLFTRNSNFFFVFIIFNVDFLFLFQSRMLLRSDRRDRRLRRPGIRATLLPSPIKKIKTPPKSTVSSTKKSAFQQSNNNTILSTAATSTTSTSDVAKKLQQQTKCNHKSLIDVNIKRLNAGNIRQQFSTSLEENACSSSIITTTEAKSTNKKRMPRIAFEKQRISSRIRKLTEKENIIGTKNAAKDCRQVVVPLVEDGECSYKYILSVSRQISILLSNIIYLHYLVYNGK